ncbi:MAG TPA: amidohydrolase family protein [Mycobacteriales bacterium]|nr:amidohydrolase family protein [Mycobacteriales bacterium]
MPDPELSGQVRSGLTRRDVLRRSGQLTAATGALWIAPEVAAGPVAEASGGSSVKVSEGTNMSAAVSPDRRLITIDLYTVIWLVPVEGGPARRLTDDLQDATLPHWSPDGRRLVFQAYRDGNYHLWVIEADGSGLRQLTHGPYDHREPKFAPDGRRIAFSSDRDGSYGIWVLDLATGQVSQRTATDAEEGMPGWSPDGRRLVFTVDNVAIDSVGEAGDRQRLVAVSQGALYGPSFAPDGRTLSYNLLQGSSSDLVVGGRPVTHGEDVFGFAPTWLSPAELLYTADGRIRRRWLATGSVRDVPFTATVSFPDRRYRRSRPDIDSTRTRTVHGIASPVLSPDGGQVAFRALNALWLMPVGGVPRRVVGDGFFSSDPAWSPDGRLLAYSSDRAGTADLWVRELATGAERRLTALPGAQLAPSWSPDSGRVAYTDHDGGTWVLDVASGEVRQVLPALFLPGRASWSRDGDTLALAAVKPYSRRYREGTSQILTVRLSTGEISYAEPMPHRSLSTRGDDGPVWSPDGTRMAFVVGSVIWVVPVDARGRITAAPRQLTDEVSDAPSWSGDSSTLLYLSNGRLRLVAAAGGTPRTVPVGLTWTHVKPRGRTVIHAGRLWDGRSRRLRPDVDIVVERDRIAAVEPHRPHRTDPVLDAAGLTVMPGLIDAHNHWHLRGRQFGDRQGRLWLSYGITTTRSPGDPAYQMVETREALATGARVGPRYLATGEAIDGSRIYYNFMRPTLSPRQLELELDRAVELGYDLIKTYVRLPVAYQEVIARRAHREGIPLSSHYHYPAVHFGMDGMEHTGATNRLGYSHTVSRLGWAYGDVIALFTASGMSMTPTLFNSAAMYAEDRSLVDDERTRILFPAWEHQRLVHKADDAAKPESAPVRAALAANVATLVRIHRGGGLIIAGTDSPLDNVAISLHQNLRAAVRYGMTPYEALTTATSNPARWMALDGDLGTVEPGKLADLAFIDGDPLADIRAAANVRQVMVGGRLHTVDELLQPFAAGAAAAAAAPANQVLAPMRSVATAEQYWWHEPEWMVHACCCPG